MHVNFAMAQRYCSFAFNLQPNLRFELQFELKLESNSHLCTECFQTNHEERKSPKLYHFMSSTQSGLLIENSGSNSSDQMAISSGL